MRAFLIHAPGHRHMRGRAAPEQKAVELLLHAAQNILGSGRVQIYSKLDPAALNVPACCGHPLHDGCQTSQGCEVVQPPHEH